MQHPTPQSAPDARTGCNASRPPSIRCRLPVYTSNPADFDQLGGTLDVVAVTIRH